MEETLDDLVVIGAGLPRTGTLSTRAALQHLLGGPCYHGAVPLVEKEHHKKEWAMALAEGKLEYATAKRILAGYKAGVDYPFFCFYKDILKMNPSAKVLLTVREPRGWYASANYLMTIIYTLTCTRPYSWFLTLVGHGGTVAYISTNMELPLGLNGAYHRALRQGEEQAIAFYNDHVAEVKAAVPPQQLLEFNVKEGWEPLCKFLDCPIPTIPFPNINDRREILIVFNSVRAITWITLLCLPVMMALLLPYFQSFLHLVFFIILGLVLLWGAGQCCRRVVRKQGEDFQR